MTGKYYRTVSLVYELRDAGSGETSIHHADDVWAFCHRGLAVHQWGCYWVVTHERTGLRVHGLAAFETRQEAFRCWSCLVRLPNVDWTQEVSNVSPDLHALHKAILACIEVSRNSWEVA